MAAGIIILPGWTPAVDSDGAPIPDARAYYYVDETTTLATIYADETLSTPLPNPLEANSSGRWPIVWADDSDTYTVTVSAPYGPAGVPFTVTGLQASQATDILVMESVTAAADQADAAAAAATSAYEDILALAASLPDTDPIVIAGKADVDGSNIISAPDQLAFRQAIGADLAQNVNFLQSGTSAVSETTQTTLRRLVVMPEQFSGTDTEKVQRAFNSAGDLPGQNVARVVRLSRFYDTTATINVPSYVTIEGVGSGRSGLRPTMSSGPALRASTANNTSSYLTEWKDFGIDGANATGSAYAVEFVGQKITTLSRLRFSSFDTSQHAVQFLLGCQSIILDQCQWYNNRMDERIGVPYVGVSFPTTIVHKGCIYEGDVVSSPSTGTEAVLLQDANGCMWDNKCVFQSRDVPAVFRVTASAGQQTAANHIWDSVYTEGNGESHSPNYTYELTGVSGQLLRGCRIVNSDIHGASPTAHVRATYTDLLFAPIDQNAVGHTWYSDGGNNTRVNLVWADKYQLASSTFADFDGIYHRIFDRYGNPSLYLGETENFGRKDQTRWLAADGATLQAQLDSTGFNASIAFKVAGTKVVGARKTGWGAPTGTATRTTFDTSTVTLPQLAERLKALLDDLSATAGHGLIGT
jgi:hypothetical protein